MKGTVPVDFVANLDQDRKKLETRVCFYYNFYTYGHVEIFWQQLLK